MGVGFWRNLSSHDRAPSSGRVDSGFVCVVEEQEDGGDREKELECNDSVRDVGDDIDVVGEVVQESRSTDGVRALSVVLSDARVAKVLIGNALRGTERVALVAVTFADGGGTVVVHPAPEGSGTQI